METGLISSGNWSSHFFWELVSFLLGTGLISSGNWSHFFWELVSFLLGTSLISSGNWSHFFWELVSFLLGTGLISSGNWSRFFIFSTTFYQQLTAATSSGTVNELSAFKNLFHLVCPYFTDHARIANKSKFTESMQIILYQFSLISVVLSDYKILGLSYQCIRCFL